MWSLTLALSTLVLTAGTGAASEPALRPPPRAENDLPRAEFGLSADWRWIDFPTADAPADPAQLAELEGLLWTPAVLPHGTEAPAEPTVRWYSKTLVLPERAALDTAAITCLLPTAGGTAGGEAWLGGAWIDGAPLALQEIGFELPTARASFGPGELAPGRHTLLVRIDSAGIEPGRRFGLEGPWQLALRPDLHLLEFLPEMPGDCSTRYDADTAPCRFTRVVRNDSPVARRCRVHFVCRGDDARVFADVISAEVEVPPGAEVVLTAEPRWDAGAEALRGIGDPALEVTAELVEYAQVIDRSTARFFPQRIELDAASGRLRLDGEPRVLRAALLDTSGTPAERSERALRRDIARLRQLGFDLAILNNRRFTLADRDGSARMLVLQAVGSRLLSAWVERELGLAVDWAAALRPLAGVSAQLAPVLPGLAHVGDREAGRLALVRLAPGAQRGAGPRVMARAAHELALALAAASAESPADAPGALLNTFPSAAPSAVLIADGALAAARTRGGLLGETRSPSFAAQLMRAQSPVERDPVCYPACGWDGPLEGPLEVFSNAETVRVFINGVQAAALDASAPGSLLVAPCDTLAHPPFVFEGLEWQPGELRVVGYVDGRPVAERRMRTPGAPVRVALVAETLDLPLVADGADSIYVHAVALDATGAVCTDFTGEFRFSTNGSAVVRGPRTVRAIAGLATVLLESRTEPGAVSIAADADGLESPSLTLAVVPPPLQQL